LIGISDGSFCPEGAGDFDDKYQPSDINKVNDPFLKENGLDAHQIKKEALATNKNLSKYDIYKDNDTGQLWVYRKGGKGEGIPTGEYLY
jgi:filamentous hemagglutinin